MFYLAQLVGSGTTLDDPIRPPVDGAKRIIDLRGDPTDPAGHCLLWTPDRQPPSPTRIVLGDDLDEPMPRAVSRILGNTLGVTLDAPDRLRSIIVELLLLHGTADHDQSRWNRLRARRGRHRIWLGELVYDAPAILGASFTETWTAANSDTIDADQDWTEVSGNHFEIFSNKVRNKTGANEDGLARAEVDLASDDHYAQADCTWTDDLSSWVGPAVRFAAAASTCYVAIANAESDVEHIFKCEAGTFTDLGSNARTLAASTLLLRLEANGSDLHAEFDSGQAGETVLDITDTAITGNVRVGFMATIRSVVARKTEVDNFEAADLAAGTPGTASPGVIAATTTLPAASVAGAAVVEPAATATSVTLPAVTPVGPGSSSPAVLATTTTLPAVAVAGSGVSEPATTSTAVTLPAVTVAGGGVTTPGVLALTVTIPQATASEGATPGVVSPAAIAAVVDLLAVSIAGAAEIAPGVIALSVTLPQVSAFQPADHPPGPATAPVGTSGTSTAPSSSATLSAVLIITGKSAATPNTGKSTAPGNSPESEAE